MKHTHTHTLLEIGTVRDPQVLASPISSNRWHYCEIYNLSFLAGYIVRISTRGGSTCNLPSNPVAFIFHSELTCLSCPILPGFHHDHQRLQNCLPWNFWHLFWLVRHRCNFQVSQLCKKFIPFFKFLQHYHLMRITLSNFPTKHTKFLWVLSHGIICTSSTTLNKIFSVTCYLKLCNIIYVYYTSHILPTNVKLVIWTL